jgi:hypothetical protein
MKNLDVERESGELAGEGCDSRQAILTAASGRGEAPRISREIAGAARRWQRAAIFVGRGTQEVVKDRTE